MLGHTCTGYFTSFITQYWNKLTVRLYTDHLDCLALSSCNYFLIKWKIISNDQYSRLISKCSSSVDRGNLLSKDP